MAYIPRLQGLDDIARGTLAPTTLGLAEELVEDAVDVVERLVAEERHRCRIE